MSQRVAGIQRTLPQVPTSSRSSRRHEKNIPRHITSEIKSRNHNKTRQMKMAHRQKLVVALACAVAFTTTTQAQIPASITTPDKVETSIGTLEYKDGAPSKETVTKAYDYLDLV